MVSGFHGAQHRSASLFLYLSFIHSLSPCVSLFFVNIPHSIVSLCSYTPMSLFSLCLLLFLCSFFHPIHCFCSCNLHASFYITHSHSFFPCLPPSLYPSPSRRRATSVEVIRYSRHIWTALTGINHEYFEVPMQGSSACL